MSRVDIGYDEASTNQTQEQLEAAPLLSSGKSATNTDDDYVPTLQNYESSKTDVKKVIKKLFTQKTFIYW
eukprot:CAMPEP_0201592972 /NCGR_PEP_ID=MMETSP0190_2-20130828/190701_1 /ASSEMBLY_ACC=CAM_ASM_000263 /TAXON_ID=37353 /ORGANISM="Rosalina sp." /LENGTH=69 /DNA_ID=CAMNT_0048051955 /DNA_START=26 /DNA_END=232 /DNA_ORIENTATION=+